MAIVQKGRTTVEWTKLLHRGPKLVRPPVATKFNHVTPLHMWH